MQAGSGASILNTVWKCSQSFKGSITAVSHAVTITGMLVMLSHRVTMLEAIKNAAVLFEILKVLYLAT